FGFGSCGAVLLHRHGGDGDVVPPARSPFDLGPLLVFAILFAIVATASAVIATYVGVQGLLATSAISGAVDVDVAVLSALRLVGTSTTAAMAADAVLIALAANALSRLVIAAASGKVRFWMPLVVATGIAAGLSAFVFSLAPGF
ncbi:DUF4010 domain-containing protein, partial [Pseudaminobacter arsenicus]